MIEQATPVIVIFRVDFLCLMDDEETDEFRML
jgi:hypothetical protein